MGEIEYVSLGDLGANRPAAFATGPFGSAVSAKNFRPAGIPMLRGNNLSADVGARLDESEMVFVAHELAQQYSRSVVGYGDLVFTCWGTIGQVGIVWHGCHFERYLVSNKQMKMSPDKRRVHSLYLYYYLSQPSMVRLVQGQAIGSSVPGFNLGQLKSLPVALPHLCEQRGIAEVLGALDDKIAANGRVVRLADDLASTTWHRCSGDGENLPLSNLASFVNGRAFTKNASGTGRVVIRIAELNSGIGASTVYNDIDVPDEHIARSGDLLFAWSGSLTVSRWFRDDAIVNQHIFKVVPDRGYPMWLVNQAVRAKLDDFRAIASDKATTMGHIQRRHLDEQVAVPDPSEIGRIGVLMNTLWERALSAEQENIALARTRDELLPLLMSGKLRVKDAEEVVSDVV